MRLWNKSRILRRTLFDLYTILTLPHPHPEVTRLRFLVTLRCLGSTERMERPQIIVVKLGTAAASANLSSRGISADSFLFKTFSFGGHIVSTHVPSWLDGGCGGCLNPLGKTFR